MAMKDFNVNARVGGELGEKLTTEAARLKVSLSEMVRMILRDYFKPRVGPK